MRMTAWGAGSGDSAFPHVHCRADGQTTPFYTVFSATDHGQSVDFLPYVPDLLIHIGFMNCIFHFFH